MHACLGLENVKHSFVIDVKLDMPAGPTRTPNTGRKNNRKKILVGNDNGNWGATILSKTFKIYFLSIFSP